jgi:hypothetical protein
MLNRRTFLKTSAATLPLAAAIETLNPATILAETIADAATRVIQLGNVILDVAQVLAQVPRFQRILIGASVSQPVLASCCRFRSAGA